MKYLALSDEERIEYSRTRSELLGEKPRDEQWMSQGLKDEDAQLRDLSDQLQETIDSLAAEIAAESLHPANGSSNGFSSSSSATFAGFSEPSSSHSSAPVQVLQAKKKRPLQDISSADGQPSESALGSAQKK